MAQDMFRPPLNRGMKVLDRTVFRKQVSVSAARVLNNQNISSVRRELDKSRDVLQLPRYQNVRPDPSSTSSDGRCVLLRPELNDQGQKWPWSPKVDELRSSRLIEVVPYTIDLDYNYWSYYEIAQAVLPNADEEDFPTSFQVVGHVAHLNLRDQFLPHKHIIAELILDKNPSLKTVINKIDDVGEESEYRTFKYELLAGTDDLNVQLKEQDCVFAFDYSQTYWNSRLNTEHERMVSLFKEGEAICDVMAGIGPFSIPAGRKRIFAWANDKNPQSYRYLQSGIERNKVHKCVRAFNEDGHTFIKSAARDLARTDVTVSMPDPRLKKAPSRGKDRAPPLQVQVKMPKTFSHYVMNLPASATDFLPDFIGLYDAETRAVLGDAIKMPMIHCYCFETKSDDNVEETKRICELISMKIGSEIRPDTPETVVYDVRDVAPKKRMFCASFRLPREVAFREVGTK